MRKQSSHCNKHIYPSNIFGQVEQCQTDKGGCVTRVCDQYFIGFVQWQ